MALNFDGVDDYVDWGSPSGLLITGDMTHSCWARWDQLFVGTYQNVLVSCGGPGIASENNYLYAFSIDSDGKLRLYWEHGAGIPVDVVSDTGVSTTTGVWHQLAFVRDTGAKEVTFYADGAQLGSVISYSDNPTDGSAAILRTAADAEAPELFLFDGRIQEEGTWATGLDAADVAKLHSGSAPGPLAPIDVQFPASYRPLRGEDPLYELDELRLPRLVGFVRGGATKATHNPTWSHKTPAGRSAAVVFAGYGGTARGLYRNAFDHYNPGARGKHAVTLKLGGSTRGQYRLHNAFARSASGCHRVGYDPYAGAARGVHLLLTPYKSTARGVHRVAYSAFGGGLRGQHPILAGYGQLASGAYRYIAVSAKQTVGGCHRVANDSLARYELYRGVDAAPDLTAAPWQTFTSLPFTTPALSAGSTYYFVLRRRNAWGLLSQNVEETAVTVNGDGTGAAARPSAPTDVVAAAAAGRTVLVTADYLYPLDGDNAADAFLVYVRSDGTNPDPDVDTPTELTAFQSDGVAKLEHTAGPFAEGSRVKVLVRTRRNGSPDVDSENFDVHTAIATASGPTQISPASAHLGRIATIEQGGLPASVGGLTLWLRADSIAGVADGAAVASWSGSTHNGYVFTQGTGSKQPLYRATAVNGRPAVECDGVDDVLQGTAAGISNTVRRTVFFVTRLLSGFSGTRTLLGNGVADWFVSADAGDDTFSSHRNAVGTQKTLAGTAGAFSSTEFRIIGFRWDTSGSNVTVEHFKNGQANGVTTFNDGYGPLPNSTWRVGALSTVNFYPGLIAEVLVFDAALSAGDRRLVEEYLAAKYAITLP